MIFSISNQKGGVGKTTSSLNLATYVAKAGKKVLLIDLDPQANLTSGLGLAAPGNENSENQAKRQTVYDVLLGKAQLSEVILATAQENLSLVPSSIDLAGAEVELVGALSRETILRQALETVKTQFDYIFIDCPPSLGLLPLNAFVAANFILIPVQCEYFALEGLSQLMNTIRLVKSRLNPAMDLGGVILTMYDLRTNLSKQVATEIRTFFKDKVFETPIPRNVKLSEAPSFGQSILKYAPESTGAQAYADLAQEFVKRFPA